MTASDMAPDLAMDVAAAEAAYHRARQREVWRRRLLPAVGIGAALLIWAALASVATTRSKYGASIFAT